MVDTKLTALTEITTLGNDDIFYVVDNPTGSPLSRKVKASDIKTFMAAAASDTVAGIIEIAIQSEMETATDVVRAVVPGRQQYHPSAVKCWLYSIVTTGTPALTSSYNITSITDTGAGLLSVTIATDFSSAYWCGVTSCSNDSAGNAGATTGVRHPSGKAAGTCDLSNQLVAGFSQVDPEAWSFVGLGDQ